MGMVKTARFGIWRVNLNPAKSSEQAGYRPVLVLSPGIVNDRLRTVVVAPMTTTLRGWPTRVKIVHGGKTGEVALDQIRAIDKTRLGKSMGFLDRQFHGRVLDTLANIFAE